MRTILAIIMLAGATSALAQPGAPLNLSAQVAGSTVTLSWTAPAGVAPEGYLIEAAMAPGGFAVATLPVTGTSIVLPNVPNGVYYVRVRVLSGGVLGAPSNEVVVTVSALQPGAPLNLSAQVQGSTVTLSWLAPAGSPPAGYVIEAAVTPGGPAIATLPTDDTAVVVPNVPNGLYFVRVRAISGGVLGAPSNEVTVTVTSGCPAPPSPPQSVRVSATGTNIALSWAPPAGGCPPTSYVILAGTAPGMSDVAQADMGAQLGLAVNAPAGTYFIRIVSVNAFGVSAPSEEFRAVLAANAFTDTLSPASAVSFTLTFQQTGTYLGRLTWLDAIIDLNLYLTTADCAYPPTGCTLAQSTATGTNLEQVSFAVTAGQTYRVWVDNATSSRPSSFTIENFLTAADPPLGQALRENEPRADPRR